MSTLADLGTLRASLPPGASLDVVLPVLDEAEALPWVLTRIPTGARAIVVDNGSSDGSAEVARAHGALVVTEPRRGYGSAVIAGLAASSAEHVAVMDADATLDPAHLVALLELVSSGSADLAMARRRPERGAWNLTGRAGNMVLAHLLAQRSRVRVKDLGPMRVARREALTSLELKDPRFGYALEMVLRAAQAGWRVSELDVPYLRRVGRSKVTGTVRGTALAVLDMSRVLRAL
jgi:glycosyltransferase involved in cell wall biosynthesis